VVNGAWLGATTPCFTWSISALIEPCYRAWGMCLEQGVTTMKCKELKAARRLITKVLADPRIGPGQRDELRKAKRELDRIAKTGKLDRDRIFRVTKIIAAILLSTVQSD
jgi:hypothetical protein